MSPLRAAILFAAAVLAGMVNAVAGGGSLISFPALVWAGLDPVIANATNTVSISPGAFAAMVPFHRELREMRAWLRRLAPPSIVGGALGAWLLLATPERVFAELVPGLILFATAVFALQETIARVTGARVAIATAPLEGGEVAPSAHALGVAQDRGGHADSVRAHEDVPLTGSARSMALLLGVQLAIAVYGGYFGAGIGIMMLAALGFLGISDVRHAIAARSFLGLCINGVAALCFAASGHVEWLAAGIMIAGQVVGGYAGARLARSVSRAAVRRAVIAIGLAMAASLFLFRR